MSNSAASKPESVSLQRTSSGTSRRQAALAVVCLAIIVLATAVQVMHHCSAFELNQEPGAAPVFCAICMTAQVVTLLLAALVWMISRLLRVAPLALPEFLPQLTECFALSVRPPPGS